MQNAPHAKFRVSLVSSGRYDSALADSAKLRGQLAQEHAAEKTRATADQSEIAALRGQVAAAQLENQQALERLTTDTRARAASCAKGLDETTALNALRRPTTSSANLSPFGHRAREIRTSRKRCTARRVQGILRIRLR